MRPILLVSLFGVVGCANVLGLDGYGEAGDAGPEAALDASLDVHAATDAGVDVSVPDVSVPEVGVADVGSDVTVPVKDAGSCVPTGPEVCSDGVDNDCNGQTDCTDPACTAGYTCVPSLPGGWTWAAYDQGARPGCAAGFTTPTDVGEGLVAPASTCGCACTTTSPTCTTGNVTVTAGTSGVNGCQDQASQVASAAGGCLPLTPAMSPVGWKVNATGPTPSGGSCAAVPAASKPAVSTTYQGRTCGFAGNVGAGCGGGGVCAPKAAPFTMCVALTGDVACPAGFAVKHLAGSTVADTRACSACTCAFSPGACGGTLTLDSDTSCTLNAAPVLVNGTCQSVPNASYLGYTYAPQTNASCTGSAVAATGSAAFSDLQTICCTN